MMINARHRSSPFTASQWQELQHQALIFKHMVSGMPIPSDLLYPMRRGLDSSSLATPTLFPPPRPFGWGSCFQIGYGRKADPEPGRCRRTDGKKWRCSKEAFQDSKYCEKHMHRGRNRSRKPVEMTRATAAKTTNSASAIPPPNTAKPSATPSLSSPSSSSIPAENHHSFHFPHSLSSRPPGLGFSSQNNTPHFNLETGSGSYSSDYRNYRYLQGLKEDVDEHAFFSEASGTLRGSVESPFDSSWQSKPMKTSSFAELKNKNCSASVFPNNYSQLQLHNNFTDEPKQQQQEQHCLVLGTDFKSGRRMKAEQEDEPQQRLRCFFDEWPLKGRDSWLDSEDNRSNRASFSSTQLSISLPMASEFPASNSKSCYDD